MNDAAPSRDPFHPPWWMLLASTIAIVALLLLAPSRHPAIPLLWVPITLAYLLRFRMPEAGLIPWVVRGTLYSIILLTGPDTQQSSRVFYLDVNFMSLIGMLMEAELAIQHFLPYGGRFRLGIMLGLSAIVLGCGATTTEPRYMAILAPLYALCAMGVLHAFKPPLTTSPAMDSPPPVRLHRRWLLQGAAIAIAVTLGFASVGGLRALYFNFGGMGARLLQQFITIRQQGGISGNETLRGSFNFAASTNRTLKINGINRVMYLRGLAFDRYETGHWRPVFERRELQPIGELQLPENLAMFFRVERLQDSLDLLYLPLCSTGFSTPPRSTNQMEKGHRAVIQSVTEKGEMMLYSVSIPPDENHQGPLCMVLSADDRKQCLDVPPEIEPGVRQIATTLRGENPMTTIRQTVHFLGENNQYSLKSYFGGEGDVVSQFLLEKKAAHCQFFASAGAMLLRLNGIPCRYVTGYVAHEGTSRSSMVVRGRDAHAWVEAWLEGVGWITVEMTPASGTPEGGDQSVGLYQRLRDLFSDIIAAIGAFVRSLSWMHVAAAGGLLVLIALILQTIRTWQQRRKQPKMRAYEFPSEAYRKLAIEFEQSLKRMGEGPGRSATWSEHIANLAAQTRRTHRQTRLDAARRFVAAYNRTRFGESPDTSNLQELRKLLHDMKDA